MCPIMSQEPLAMLGWEWKRELHRGLMCVFSPSAFDLQIRLVKKDAKTKTVPGSRVDRGEPGALHAGHHTGCVHSREGETQIARSLLRVKCRIPRTRTYESLALFKTINHFTGTCSRRPAMLHKNRIPARKSYNFLVPFITAALMLLTAAQLIGQVETGQIAGTVMDQTGAAVPDAIVAITNLSTNTVR